MTLKSTSLKRLAMLFLLSSAALQTGCRTEVDTLSHSSAPILSSTQAAEAPKNIIVFIGDGMGISTITAGRIFVGQEKGQTGEENELSFDKFPQLALIKTYNTNAQVPDSAGTATAILSGYKTNIGAVNVRPRADIRDMAVEGCSGPTLPTLTDKAKRASKGVGVISTARLTHATPAAMYAHSASRDIEADKDLAILPDFLNCKSIAGQLIASDVDIALGGGRKEFTADQITSWPGAVVADAAEMEAAPQSQRVLGLFNASHMSFEADRSETKEPSLAEMTTFTMDRLSSNPNGYVMMVEAGRIDHAHHGSNAYRAMKDLQALDQAVAAAIAKADKETLILVTADHSHVFTMAGYPVRGNPIMGLVRGVDRDTGGAATEYTLDEDGKPYTTLGYHNGPNVREADSPALTDNVVQGRDYRQQTAVNLGSETHAGEDVALYATGPSAERFSGVMEQNEIGEILGDLMGE